MTFDQIKVSVVKYKSIVDCDKVLKQRYAFYFLQFKYFNGVVETLRHTLCCNLDYSLQNTNIHIHCTETQLWWSLKRVLLSLKYTFHLLSRCNFNLS